MPKVKATDPATGDSFAFSYDGEPPNEDELEQLFTQNRINQHNAAAKKAGPPPVVPKKRETGFMPGYEALGNFGIGAAKEVPSMISGMIPETFKHPVRSAETLAGGILPYFQQHPEEIPMGPLGPISRSIADQSVESYQRQKARGMPTISALAAGVPLVGPTVAAAGERVAGSKNPQELAQALGAGATDIAPILAGLRGSRALNERAMRGRIPIAETTPEEIGSFPPPAPPPSPAGGVEIPPSVEMGAALVPGIKGFMLRRALGAMKKLGKKGAPPEPTEADLRAILAQEPAEGDVMAPSPEVVGAKMKKAGDLTEPTFEEWKKIHGGAQEAGSEVKATLAKRIEELMNPPEVPLGPQGEMTAVVKGMGKPAEGWTSSPKAVAKGMKPPEAEGNAAYRDILEALKKQYPTSKAGVLEAMAQKISSTGLTPAPAAAPAGATLQPSPVSSTLPGPPPPPIAGPPEPPSAALSSAAGEMPTANPGADPTKILTDQIKAQLGKGDYKDLRALDEMIEKSSGEFRKTLRQIRQQHMATRGVRHGDFHIVGEEGE